MIARFGQIINNHSIKVLLLAVWITLLAVWGTSELILQYGGFALLGVIGAIFANATGAGGGVVFVPFFNQLNLPSETIVATSFAIQCCGMTAGAISWYRFYQIANDGCLNNESLKSEPVVREWSGLPKGLFVTVPTSIIGILFAQFVLSGYTEQVQAALHVYFGIFSIVLAFAIYASVPLMSKASTTFKLTSLDIVMLILIAFAGGVITAWLSVGVGELVAVYLILRGFNISFAIALAVILTAFTVHGAIYYHIFVSGAVYWQVVLFAGAGAIVGGLIAKHVVLYFSPAKLKIFFASWVLIMGLAGLPIFS